MAVDIDELAETLREISLVSALRLQPRSLGTALCRLVRDRAGGYARRPTRRAIRL